jgi:Glycosyl transferase family 2
VSPPSEFRVVALVAAYNEADVIGQVVGALIDQGVQVHLLDDDSTDATIATVEPYLGRGVIGIERLADTLGPREPGRFEWERILRRKAELARTLDADWFIHHDADEFRESPWADVPLHQALARVDALGYNAVDFASFDFWPVDDSFRPGDDVRRAFRFCSPQAAYDRLQVRCWKQAEDVDLASSGGHDVAFEGRRVFPLRFILRHYPIRGRAHGERKVLRERQPRFLEGERARGWHVQYEGLSDGHGFIRDPATLTPYDPDAVRLALAVRNRNVEAVEAQLECAHRELDALRGELQRTAGALAARAEEVAALREAVGAGERELAARTSDAAAERAARERLTADLVALQAALDARLTELDGLARANADAVGRVAALEQSLSWRWTAPARAAYRLLGGR